MSSSIVTVKPGETVRLGVGESRNWAFDWDRQNLSPTGQISTSTFTITAVRQASAAMTKDSEQILNAANATIALQRTVSTDSRVTLLRVIGTTATLGDVYILANKIVTNEVPIQTKEQSIRVIIQNG